MQVLCHSTVETAELREKGFFSVINFGRLLTIKEKIQNLVRQNKLNIYFFFLVIKELKSANRFSTTQKNRAKICN